MRNSRLVKALRRGRDENPSLDISSLIDVSFLLLIYFLVTSTLDPTEGDLQLSMAGGGGFRPAIEIPTIELNNAGVVFFEEEVLDSNTDQRELVMLLDRLKTYSEASWIIDPDQSAAVKLKISDGAKSQRFIDIMNCLAEVGISNVTFLDVGE